MVKIILIKLLIILWIIIVTIGCVKIEDEPKIELNKEVDVEPKIELNKEVDVEPKEIIEEPVILEHKNSFIVTRVVDGDTVEIETGEKVRFICIDTPERGEYYYQEAKNYLSDYILNKEVKLIKDISETDMYGRLLRYVYFEDIFINGKLVEGGYAKVYRYAPDTKFCDDLDILETQAKNKYLGIWSEIEDKEEPDINDITSSEYICDFDFYNCGDFKTHKEAQAAYDACGGMDDIHELDRDKDGIVCESLK